MTFQPSEIRSAFDRSSRRWFAPIFSRQKSVRDFGNLNTGHISWPCQKQPWTNITASYFGRIISGLLGKEAAWILNRNPIACRSFRTRISGFVFFPLIPAIISDRLDGVTISTNSQISLGLGYNIPISHHCSSDCTDNWNRNRISELFV